MFNGKTILSIIPARAGSKGLPNKNILDCAGKPLIQWTIDAAMNSRYVDRTIISTDSQQIVRAAKEAGADIPFLRPESLATDNASIHDVIKHALGWLANNEKRSYDYFLLLQPTSPLRTSRHIEEAVEYFFAQKKNEEETLVSVYPVGAKYGWLMQADDKGHIHFCFDPDKRNSRRQDLSAYYLPNGAIYLASSKFYQGVFYHDKTLFYQMPPEISIDVDTREDLEAAIKYLKRLKPDVLSSGDA